MNKNRPSYTFQEQDLLKVLLIPVFNVKSLANHYSGLGKGLGIRTWIDGYNKCLK